VGSADLLGINGPQVVFGNISQSPLLSNGQPNPAFISPLTGALKENFATTSIWTTTISIPQIAFCSESV
jgi:hypothetical protein